MPTFQYLAGEWLSSNPRLTQSDVNVEAINNAIGDIDIKKLSPKILKSYFAWLYDEAKIRGSQYNRYKEFVFNVCEYAFEKGYLYQLSPIDLRYTPPPNKYNAPDENALKTLFIRENGTAAVTVIRLAWQCGLVRNEIPLLKWNDVDFDNALLVLPDRKIPIPEETLYYLEDLYADRYSDYVLVSQERKSCKPMAKQYLTKLARDVLDKYDQHDVRLSDLRYDFIIRALQQYDWEYVSYISGIDYPSIRDHYMPYLQTQSVDPDPISNKIEADAILDLIKRERTSNRGLAIRLVWEFGIPVTALPQITWNVVDFENSIMRFPDRVVKIPEDLLKTFSEIKTKDKSDYIFHTENNNPIDYTYILKLTQKALVRNGISGITLSDLQNEYWRLHNDELSQCKINPENGIPQLSSIPYSAKGKMDHPLTNDLLEYLKENRFVDSATIQNKFALSAREARRLLKSCTDSGKITRIGYKYFLPKTVVSSDKHHEVILKYVAGNQPVTSDELTDLLGLADRRQIYSIIKPLLESGELVRKSANKYFLPDEKTK